MKVKTGLPHEENGGVSIALFGKPHMLSSSSDSIHVDCSIIIDTGKVLGDGNNTLELAPIIENISDALVKKMYSHAKKLTKQFIQDKKKNWTVLNDQSVYFQDGHWRGFYFNVEK